MKFFTSADFRYREIKSTIKTILDYFKYHITHTWLLNCARDFRNERMLRKLHISLIRTLDKQGFIILDNYLSREQCNHAVAELKASFEKFPNYVRASEDLRIFGVENIIPAALKLASEPLFKFLAGHVNAERSDCAFTLGGWLRAGKGGSSGNGWHRDAFFNQFKAMLYLTDVSEKNGPFELLPGTHRLASVLNATLAGGMGYMQDRISDEEVMHLERVLKKPRRSVTGAAGTLVLFNSSVIHRGKPIEEGERLALTNYYFPLSYDINSILEKFRPVLTFDELL